MHKNMDFLSQDAVHPFKYVYTLRFCFAFIYLGYKNYT